MFEEGEEKEADGEFLVLVLLFATFGGGGVFAGGGDGVFAICGGNVFARTLTYTLLMSTASGLLCV